MNGLWMDFEWIVNGLWMAHERFVNGLWMVCERLMNGLWMARKTKTLLLIQKINSLSKKMNQKNYRHVRRLNHGNESSENAKWIIRCIFLNSSQEPYKGWKLKSTKEESSSNNSICLLIGLILKRETWLIFLNLKENHLKREKNEWSHSILMYSGLHTNRNFSNF